jgi:hypothetical protein
MGKTARAPADCPRVGPFSITYTAHMKRKKNTRKPLVIEND